MIRGMDNEIRRIKSDKKKYSKDAGVPEIAKTYDNQLKYAEEYKRKIREVYAGGSNKN